MKPIQTSIGIPALTMLAIVSMAAFSATGMAAEDDQAEREARRMENEFRRQDAQARRDIEDRGRAQAEALRGQEEAIRRMEATQARMNADAEQRAQQAAEQVRMYANTPVYTYSIPSTPSTPASPVLAPAASELPAVVGLARHDDPVTGMGFESLSEQLGSYFGVQSGVLVVRAGANTPFGLQDGDVILAIDGRVPTDGQHAAGILRSYKPGERVKLKVQRNRRAIDVDTVAPGQRGN